MDALAAELFYEVIGVTLADFGKQDLLQSLNMEELMAQVLNAEWSGTSYSKRIWHNTNQLAVELEKQLEMLVAAGKNPDQIKAELKRRFNVSYRVADRLIRTESSYIYNAAALESYKRAGVEKVEFLAEADCCDLCVEHRHKCFSIDALPLVPVHPNCRCTYVPIVE